MKRSTRSWSGGLPWPAHRAWALLLFTATALTTTVVGARLQFNFDLGRAAYASDADIFPFVWAWHHPNLIPLGLPFSLALMAILLAHELGHFFACRRYGLDCTYPLFLPTPTLIGTMGAFIRIKSPFMDQRELFDVGIAGPLAGMAVIVPLLLHGLATSPVAGAQPQPQWIVFAWPPLAGWMEAGLHPSAAIGGLAPSPILRAAWVGMLVTMMNLIPAAQLDGGHIVYALSPALHKWTSWAALAVLLAGGYWCWPGWYVFAALIALMRVRHPYVPKMQPLGAARWGLAALALGIFALTFMAAPVFTP